MVAKEGLSIGPGSYVGVDLEAKIFPGNYVLANLLGYDEPVVSVYKAARPYTKGVQFTLEALNPAFAPIHISAPSECLQLARISFTTTLL
jgi:SOS-response transcriptional repressor LexA